MLSAATVTALCCALAGAPRLPDPPLTDLCLFPPRDVVREAWQLNVGYQHTLAFRRPLAGRWWEYDQAIRETEQLYLVWNALDDAQAYWQTEAWRRRKLAELRRLLGPRDYYAGRLPPPVPVWRMEVIPP